MAPADDAPHLRWAAWSPDLLPAWLRFAIANFGRHAYQANPQYPHWLHAENPAPARSPSDFLVGLDAHDQVVASAHKLRLPWRVNGKTVDVPALHNLMAAPEHRQGVGAMLILSAFAKDAHILIAGATGPLSSAYEKLRCQRVEAHWFRWVLNPVGAAYHLGRARLGAAAPHWKPERLNWVRRALTQFTFETDCSEGRCAEVAAALNTGPADAARPAWSAELVRWRFFHPLGPRHLLLESRSTGALALLSLGRHRGARVARAIELRAPNAAALRALLTATRAALPPLGGDVLLGFSADPTLNAQLHTLGGHRLLDHPVDTWLYHRKRGETFAAVAFQGGAGDFGFEAI